MFISKVLKLLSSADDVLGLTLRTAFGGVTPSSTYSTDAKLPMNVGGRVETLLQYRRCGAKLDGE